MTWIFTLLSGLLLGLSLPPNPFGMLEWVAFAPVFLAARRSGPIKALVLGIVTVLASSFLLIFPMQTPEELGNAGGGTALFALLIGWTCAFAAALKTDGPWKWAVGVAAAGVLGEWMTHGLFPLYSAMGQWQNPSVMPVASWVGVWGISFLVYAFNAALAVAGDHLLPARRSEPVPQEARRRAVRCALGAAGILAAVHLAGWGINRRPVEGSVLRVAAMQPDVEEFEPLVRQAAKAGARVLVWPELALSEPIAKDLTKYRQPGLHQVIGYAGEQPEKGMPHNYAALVGPEGEILARYSKIHLFGSERFVHEPGRELVVADGPAGKAGLAICYDTMFTEIARGLTRKGAQILYVPNMDPNAHRGALHALHAAATVFRAAENGVPLVRSEWRGYSMIIDARGRILGNAAMSSPTVLVADLVVPTRPGTLYTRTGDLFPWACLALLIGLIVTEMREERGKQQKRDEGQRDTAAEEPEMTGSPV